MPNQRPPNSFHHENALSSDLVINETPKLRTQPMRAWHSRNERLTPHIPAQNCPRKKAVTIQPSKAGCQHSLKGDGKKKKQSSSCATKKTTPPQKKQPSSCSTKKKTTKKKTNLHRSRVPAYTHNLMTAFDIALHFDTCPKKMDRFRCVL